MATLMMMSSYSAAREEETEVNGYTLGLIHGWGPRSTGETGSQSFHRCRYHPLWAFPCSPACIEHKLVFNPGSPLLNQDSTGTFGILELGETISHQIIRLDS